MRTASSRPRAAFTLTEVLASVAITTFLLGGMAAFTVKTWNEMAAARSRDGVAHWAANCLEEARAAAAAGKLSSFADTINLPGPLTRHIVDPAIVASIANEPSDSSLRRVEVEVRWTGSTGSPVRPVRVATLVAVPGGKP